MEHVNKIELVITSAGGNTKLIVNLNQAQRQLVLLSLAKLSLARPGFDHALGEVARKLLGTQTFEEFKSHGPDPAEWAAFGHREDPDH